MAGFNPHGGKKGPQLKLPAWLTGNYGAPNYYEQYAQSRGGRKPGPGIGRGANAQEMVMPQADPSLLDRVPSPGTGVVIPAAPVTIPAGTVQPTAIIKGLTPAGTVDYSQGDEYKSQMAQYQNLINQKKQEEAEDLGMKIWMDKYGGKLGLTGPNPLMEDFGGFVPTQGPTPAVLQASETPLKAFGQEVKTYFPGAGPESFNPIDAQDQQQEATATQADMATTAGMSAGDRARNLTRAFRLGLI